MSMMTTCRTPAASLATAAALFLMTWGDATSAARAADAPGLIRSARSGPWSAPATWEGGKVPGAGSRVQVRPEHAVIYDVKSDELIRSIHVAGTLRFPSDKDTRLDVGLIKIQPGEDASEDGFDCDAHVAEMPAGTAAARPGSRHPRSAHRRQAHRADPADVRERHGQAVVPGHRLLRRPHGLPRRSPEPHLGQARRHRQEGRQRRHPGRAGHGLEGRRPRHRHRHEARPTRRRRSTEERTIRGHRRRPASPSTSRWTSSTCGDGRLPRRGRQPEPQRRRRVGRPARGARPHDVPPLLGRLDQLRRVPPPRQGGRARPYACTTTWSATPCAAAPSSAPSIWDSDNRWLTIHGTNYLVVRDCVGYQSVGHGFFLEDGTEVYNVLDRNLAVQALPAASRCPSRCCPSTTTTGPASGGPTASTPSRATCPAKTTITATSSTLPRPKVVLPLRMADGTVQRAGHPHPALLPLRGQRSPRAGVLRLQVRRRRREPIAARRPAAPLHRPQSERLGNPLQPSAEPGVLPGGRSENLRGHLRHLSAGVRSPRLSEFVVLPHRPARPGPGRLRRRRRLRSRQRPARPVHLRKRHVRGVPLRTTVLRAQRRAPRDGVSAHFRNIVITDSRAARGRLTITSR